MMGCLSTSHISLVLELQTVTELARNFKYKGEVGMWIERQRYASGAVETMSMYIKRFYPDWVRVVEDFLNEEAMPILNSG